MKRKVLLALAPVMWLLICCTVFSFKIEELMTAKVVTADRPSFGAAVLPLETAFRDETGWHLYYTYEGAGWEGGTRVAELDSGSFTVYDDPEAVDGITGLKIQPHVEASAPRKGRMIQYSSHPPKAGEPAEILDRREHSDDTWLVISALPLPETLTLPSGLEPAAGNDTSLLLTVPDEPLPFLEPEARARLADTKELAELITPLARDDLRVYSLTDIERFLNNLPRIAALFVMFFAPAALWVAACVLSRRRGGIGLILTNLAITALDGACIPRLLDTIDLPYSLLPGEMIFDVAHYVDTSREISRSMLDFSYNGRVQAVQSAGKNACMASAAIILASMILTLTLCAIQAKKPSSSCFSQKRRAKKNQTGR